MYKRNAKYVLPKLAEVMKKDKLARRKWFEQLKVGHRNLTETLQLLVEYFDRGPDTNMIFLIGMTGIGKTSLATNALTEALVDLWAEEAGPDTCTVLFVAVRSNGQNSFSWGDLYRDVLKRGAACLRKIFVKPWSKTA
ncbi:hypothetical protein AU476_12690 [Cupriavidus sp. UYMSc13B]|nr:hypothetical protein AU476_12690 [Cupriavidus sp. UYMSc13B]